ncbi:MAG: hypothetical protein WCT20_01380 [Candidatus Babeliales bacterium]|jgi:hypothetical protein
MKFVNRAILCVCLLQVCSKGIEAKGLFKTIAGIVTNNPIKPITKMVTGPNNFIPLDPRDLKKGIFGENFHVVQSGALYRSAQLSGHALDGYIKQYHIKTIINLRGAHPDEKWWKDEKAVVDKYNIAYFNIPTSAATLTSKENIAAILTGLTQRVQIVD